MYPSVAKLIPRDSSGCHVSKIVPSVRRSRYDQKKGAVSRAIFGALRSHSAILLWWMVWQTGKGYVDKRWT
jgi:hypothetical protein